MANLLHAKASLDGRARRLDDIDFETYEPLLAAVEAHEALVALFFGT